LPVWFTETVDGHLTQVNIDEEADPQGWYCENCFECEEGAPVATAHGEISTADEEKR
jgi:hypothetical protein